MRVKVGSKYYDVQFTTRLLDTDGATRLNGSIDHQRLVIELDDDSSDGLFQETLWHEIVHAILVHFCVREHDEILVDQMAKGFLMILEDNPGILDKRKKDV